MDSGGQELPSCWGLRADSQSAYYVDDLLLGTTTAAEAPAVVEGRVISIEKVPPRSPKLEQRPVFVLY